MKEIQSFQNWRQLIVIQAGGALCLPLFVVGYHLAKNYGFSSALAGIVVGNLILYLLATMMLNRCLTKRLSTSELSQEVFGDIGKYFFSAIMVFSLIGWFAIQLTIMGDALGGLLPIVGDYPIPLRVGLGILATLTAIFGLKGLEVVANFSLPLLCATVGYALWVAQGGEASSLSFEKINFAGTSLVIASCLSAVIDLPTFFRQAASKREGRIALTLLFCCVVPLIQAVGVYLCLHNQAENLTEVLSLASSHPLWKVWIGLFVLLAGWTTNNTNIYSASVNMVRLVPNLSNKVRIAIAGAIGIVFSIIPFLGNFASILELIGIFLSGMGAAILFSRKDESPVINLIGWGLGVGFGLIGLSGFSLLDAFVVTSLVKGGSLLFLNVGEKNEVY